jgi:hypothetical protein
MDATVATYLAYIATGIVLVAWVARTLSRNGRIFLVDVFNGNEPLADSVNHLLVVGFCLINFGYIALALRVGHNIASARQAIEACADKVGMVLLVLGAMHFFNLYVFSRIRRRSQVPPPLPR